MKGVGRDSQVKSSIFIIVLIGKGIGQGWGFIDIIDADTKDLSKVCRPFLTGINPKYKNWFIGLPLITKAASKLEAPGIGDISIKIWIS